MTKKNLPNIPIYIGDWERDCNVLGLESEAAWMRIVFKLWTKGKQNSIKMTAKGLQNLWRCSEEKMNEILDELIFNEIADISITDGIIEFTCRRFVKENKISEVRSKAAKSGSRESKIEAKQKQNSNKTLSKKGQNTDYDIENEVVNETKDKKGGVEEKKEIELPYDSEKFKAKWGEWKEYKHKEHRFRYKTAMSEQAALSKLTNLARGEPEAIQIIQEAIANGWKGFFPLKFNNNNHEKQKPDPRFDDIRSKFEGASKRRGKVKFT